MSDILLTLWWLATPPLVAYSLWSITFGTMRRTAKTIRGHDDR